MKTVTGAITALAAAIAATCMVLLFVQLRSQDEPCAVARALYLQHAGRERAAIDIWDKRGVPEIGTVWRGLAADDEAAAAACLR